MIQSIMNFFNIGKNNTALNLKSTPKSEFSSTLETLFEEINIHSNDQDVAPNFDAAKVIYVGVHSSSARKAVREVLENLSINDPTNAFIELHSQYTFLPDVVKNSSADNRLLLLVPSHVFNSENMFSAIKNLKKPSSSFVELYYPPKTRRDYNGSKLAIIGYDNGTEYELAQKFVAKQVQPLDTILLAEEDEVEHSTIGLNLANSHAYFKISVLGLGKGKTGILEKTLRQQVSHYNDLAFDTADKLASEESLNEIKNTTSELANKYNNVIDDELINTANKKGIIFAILSETVMDYMHNTSDIEPYFISGKALKNNEK